MFEEVVMMMYTIEFQKRDLPHIHILIILKYTDKLQTVEDIDRFISTELLIKYYDSDVYYLNIQKYVFDLLWCQIIITVLTIYFNLSLTNISYLNDHGDMKKICFKYDVDNEDKTNVMDQKIWQQ